MSGGSLLFSFFPFFGMWWVWGVVVGWTLQQRFSFSGPGYIEIFMCLIRAVYMSRCWMLVWRQKYVNHLVISTHCLDKGGRECLGGKKGRQISSWPFRRLFCKHVSPSSIFTCDDASPALRRLKCFCENKNTIRCPHGSLACTTRLNTSIQTLTHFTLSANFKSQSLIKNSIRIYFVNKKNTARHLIHRRRRCLPSQFRFNSFFYGEAQKLSSHQYSKTADKKILLLWRVLFLLHCNTL